MESIGLENLGDLILEKIISKLDAKQGASIACVSKRLQEAASDDNLWKIFCSRDFDLDSPLDADDNPCPSFKATYRVWNEMFGMYPFPLVKRVKKMWVALRNWMAVNFPEAGQTLRKGASEDELVHLEKTLRVKLPVTTKLLYRFCDGQNTAPRNIAEHRMFSHLGIIGGYEFYDHVINVHFLRLGEVLAETRQFNRATAFSAGSKHIIVAASYSEAKFFFLNCANGQLYVGSSNLLLKGEMLPCVPQSLVRPLPDANYVMPQDALLLWFEEHCRRLHSGMTRTRIIRKSKTLSLYPEVPPACSVAVTNGVQVRASSVFVPEMCDMEGENKYYYTYSIRMSLLPEGCVLGGVHYSSCQLYSRHWIIRSKDNVVSEVNGEAVIGQYPFLTPGKEEFVYESCTPLYESPGSVEGHFTFVPGSLGKPEGKQFNVRVAPFPLEAPGYIF